MLSNHDLYDLSATFVRIRNDVQYELNVEILNKIIYILKNNDSTYEDNQIRKLLSLIKNLDRDKWYFVYHYNVYVQYTFLKNKSIYQLLLCGCSELKRLLIRQEYQNAYELVDAIHCLPEIIVENNFIIPKSYWKTFIKPYRNRWNKNFWLDEQKSITD